MKKFAFILTVLSVFAFTACEKEDLGKKDLKSDWDKPYVDPNCEGICGGGLMICPDDMFIDPANVDPMYEAITLEELVYSDDCGCIVSGQMKYLKDGITVALVYYGDGSCDNMGTKIMCTDGNCEEGYGQLCYFDQNCNYEEE